MSLNIFGSLGLSREMTKSQPIETIPSPRDNNNQNSQRDNNNNNSFSNSNFYNQFSALNNHLNNLEMARVSNSPSVMNTVASQKFLKNFLGKENFCVYKIVKNNNNNNNTEPTLSFDTFNLEVEQTELEPFEEQRLRKYIHYKAERGLVSKNSIGILPGDSLGAVNQNNIICYHSLIEVQLENKSQDMIVCLTCEVNNDEGFTLFSSDLDSFVDEIRKILQKKKSKDNTEYLRTTLSSWYSYTVKLTKMETLIEYIYRCFDLIRDKFDVIFCAALVDRKFYIVQTDYNESFIDDMWKFIRALKMGDLKDKNLIVVKNPSEIPEDAITIELDDEYNLNVRGKDLDTNDFCKKTRKELLAVSSRDPLLLRHIIENQKHKVLQEHLQLKKLIEHSKMNNYSLYKSFRLLKTSPNRAVILKLLLSQQDSTTDNGTKEAINVIAQVLGIKLGL